MRKQIGILGADSFLAKAIIDKLSLNPDYSIYLFNRSVENKPEVFSHSYYHIPSTDIRTSSLIEFDVLIYCASAGLQPGNNDSEELINEVNYNEPARIINYLIEKNYKGKLITFGSYFEIGISKTEELYDETKIIHHNNLLPNSYAQSKHNLTKFINAKIT